jgi:hypothetical protein
MRKVPPFWFARDVDVWVGKSWKDVELFGFMRQWPANMDDPKKYVVFYSRNCDHCEEMFINDLIDSELASKVTAIAVPHSKTELLATNAWYMPLSDCELLDLPVGSEWIISTPLALRIENGVVTCAEESNHRGCFELE